MSINKSLVSVFKTLQKNDSTSKKFTKLANLYGTLTFNDKLFLKFYNDFKQNRKDITKLAYFKNTNIRKVLVSMSNDDKNSILVNLKTAFKIAEKHIITGGEQKHECGNNCSHDHNDMEKLLGNKKIAKMLKKKGVKEQLQKTLGKQFNMKNGNIEDMLKSAMKDQLPEGEYNMLNSVLSNPMVKSLSDKLLSEENLNKLKDVFMDFIADDEIAQEINNIKSIFNETKVMNVVTELFGKIKNLDDISNIQSLVENNADIKDIVGKFENAMKSGLINEEKLVGLAQKAADKFMAELKNMNILDGKNMGMLKTVIGQFGGGSLFGDSKPEKKLTRQERRAKAMKKYRRNKRTELKNKKKGKRNNKKRN